VAVAIGTAKNSGRTASPRSDGRSLLAASKAAHMPRRGADVPESASGSHVYSPVVDP
jgi:hypothetical protein